MCFKAASSAFWVTCGNLCKGQEPLYAMISGIARELKTEMNFLRMNVLDLDQKTKISDPRTCDILLKFEERVANSANRDDDTEFRLQDGVIYISRPVADDALNEQSRDNAEEQTSTQEISIKNLGSTPISLDIDKPAVLSTLHFRKDYGFDLLLKEDHVEIEVEGAGLNNKKFSVVTGRHHSDTFSDECAETITKVGNAVKEVKPGDSVCY